MGGTRNRDEKRKANRVFSSGSGGGTAGPSKVDKRGEELPCPHCERIFKQKERLLFHIKKQHADAGQDGNDGNVGEGSAGGPSSTAPDEAVAGGPAPAASAQQQQQQQRKERVMDVGSKGGAYDKKSPKLMLSEWCAKLKRPRPRYRLTTKEDGSVSCKVVLPDPKDNKKDVVVFLDDAYAELAGPSEEQAAQRGAVAALHRLAGDRALELLLPAEYRQQWAELGQKAATRAEAAERRAECEVAQKDRQKRAAAGSWKRSQTAVVMSDDKRRLVEGVLQGLARDAPALLGHSADLPEEATQLAAELRQLGFAARHAESAARSPGVESVADALHWLCLNIPEEELPKRFAPGGSARPVSVIRSATSSGALASGAAATAASDGGSDPSSLVQLISWGYPRASAVEAMQRSGPEGDVLGALSVLYGMLTGLKARAVADASDEPWAEEREVLEAIYGEEASSFEETPKPCARLRLTAQLPAAAAAAAAGSGDAWEDGGGGDGMISVTLRAWPVEGYPAEAPPLMALTCEPQGALSAQQQRLLTAAVAKQAADLIGEPSIHSAAAAVQDTLDAMLGGDGDAIEGPAGAPAAPAPQLWQKLAGRDGDPFSSHATSAAAAAGGGKSDTAAAGQQGTKEAARGRPQPRARPRGRPQPTPAERQAESQRLMQQLREWNSSRAGGDMRRVRESLPAAGHRAAILDAVGSSKVAVVCGATGCGKSTQVPQYILEEATDQGRGAEVSIIVTQPRRISATGLAARVSDERGEQVGGVVGYSVRLDTKASARTRLLFCTTGVLLRRLIGDPSLGGVTHVVLDEVHERSIESDLLLLLLKRALGSGNAPNLRLVLMSATADAKLFSGYFEPLLKSQGERPPRVLSIPGRTFPVRDMYLEDALAGTGFTVGPKSKWARSDCKDAAPQQAVLQQYGESVARSLSFIDQEQLNYDLIEDLVAHVVAKEAQGGPGALLQGWEEEGSGEHASSSGRSDAKGSILIFMPGAEEINRVVQRLSTSSKVRGAGGSLWVLPLHGGLPPAQQSRVFQRPPGGARKVVVATNVAETSITIEDCTCVIDCCRAKEVGYDPTRGMTALKLAWISQASAQQRRGRAGRVRPGCCFRLVSKRRYSSLAEHTAPEILRCPLQGLVLQVKAVLGRDVDVPGLLGEALTPPSDEAVGSALSSLCTMGALDATAARHTLTALGMHLATLPMDAHIAKLLIYSCLLRCVSPALTIAAAMAYGRPLFVSPMDKRQQAEDAKRALTSSVAGSKSDHLALVAAYNGWRAARAAGGRSGGSAFCQEYFMVESVLEGISASRRDYVRQLQAQGLLPASYSAQAADDAEVAANRAGAVARQGGPKGGHGGYVKQGGVGAAAATIALEYSHEMDANSDNARVVKAAVAAGLYPNLLRVQTPPAKFQQVAGGTVELEQQAVSIKFFDRTRGRVFLHPSSLNFKCGKFESGWLVYSEIMETAKVFVRETTMVPVYGLLLFGGAISVQHQEGTLQVDGWATFKAPARIGALLQQLRGQMDALLLRQFEDTAGGGGDGSGGGDVVADEQGERTMHAVLQLLAMDGF